MECQQFCNQTFIYYFFEIVRWFKHAAQPSIKVAFFGAVSCLTLAVLPFCIVFAVLWAVYRDYKFAWIGQDILVSQPLNNICYVNKF